MEGKIDTNNKAVSNKLSALEQRMQGLEESLQQQQQQRAAAEATAQAQTANTVAGMETMLEKFIKKERTESRNELTGLLERASAASSSSSLMIIAELEEQEKRQIQRDKESAAAAAAAAPSNVLEQMQSLLDQHFERQSEHDKKWKNEVMKDMKDELRTFKVELKAEYNSCLDIEKITLKKVMTEYKNSFDTAVDDVMSNNAAKLSSLEQTMEPVQTTVVSVEKICKETKTKIAAIRAIVGKNELTCNQTKESVNSFGNELSLFIEQQGDEEEESDNEDDGEDDIEGDDDTEDGEESIVDKATSLKRKRESQWMAHYDRLLQCCKNHDEFPDRRILDDAYTDFKLGGWVQNQRYNYKNKRISDERVKLLNEVPGWKWIVGAGRKRAKN